MGVGMEEARSNLRIWLVNFRAAPWKKTSQSLTFIEFIGIVSVLAAHQIWAAPNYKQHMGATSPVWRYTNHHYNGCNNLRNKYKNKNMMYCT